MTNLDSVLKNGDITLPTKVCKVKAMGFPSGHVRAGPWRRRNIEELMSFQIAVLEKTPESPLDSKQIKPANLKGNQFWILFGRTGAEAETPVFQSSDVNSWLLGKVPDTG